MADTKKLQQQLNSATLETRNAFDKLKKWDSLSTDYLKKNKEEYQAIQLAYKTAQEKKNQLQKEVNAVKKTEEDAIKAKSANNVYKKSLDALTKAELGIVGLKGEEKYIEAYKKAQEAYKAAVASGKSPTALPESKVVIPVDETVDAKGNPIKEPSLNEFITTITDPKNKKLLIDVQKDLAKNFDYKGPTDGSPSTSLLTSIQKAYQTRGILPEAWRGTDFRTFLSSPNVDGTGGTGSGTGGGQYDPYGSLQVWDKTKTKIELNALYQDLFERDATDKEIDSIYAKIDKKQKDQKATVTKYKMINGVRTAVTTPGFNQGQFVTDLVKNTQEYKDTVDKKTKQKESVDLLATQTLQGVADKNGITLSPDQLETFSLRVKKGEDVSIVGNDIRKLAGIGQPDSIKKLIDSGIDLSIIYSPYKNILAQTLEINPSSITLNDPTLRMAIGPEKEMSLYEYQRALRKDNRWQYTDQARGEASDVATTVLRDFGFMG